MTGDEQHSWRGHVADNHHLHRTIQDVPEIALTDDGDATYRHAQIRQLCNRAN